MPKRKKLKNAKDTSDARKRIREVSGNAGDFTDMLGNVTQKVEATENAVGRLISDQQSWMDGNGGIILKRLTDIEESSKRSLTLLADMANWRELQDRNEKLTSRECAQIRNEINQRVSDVLGLEYENGMLTDDSVRTREKYFPMFMYRIYADLKESQVLAERITDTPHMQFEMALERIRSWEPGQGVSLLKKKADQNRRSRLQVEISCGNDAEACSRYYLSRRKQRAINEIRKQDLEEIERSEGRRTA